MPDKLEMIKLKGSSEGCAPIGALVTLAVTAAGAFVGYKLAEAGVEQQPLESTLDQAAKYLGAIAGGGIGGFIGVGIGGSV